MEAIIANTVEAKKKPVGAVECTLNDLLYPVSMINNPYKSNSEYSKWIMGELDGKEFFINACSSRYELVPNADIFPAIEEMLTSRGVKFTATYRHFENVRFYARYKIDSKFTFTVNGKEDKIFFMLEIQHSYNGLTPYSISWGAWRQVCKNGLCLPCRELAAFDLNTGGKHFKSIKESFAMLTEKIDFFTTNINLIKKAVKDQYELLGGMVVINPVDRIKEVMQAVKMGAIENKNFNTYDEIMKSIKDEVVMYNGQVNDWLIYNGINQYLFSERTTAAPEKKRETDSKILEYMLQHPAVN
jgi:hypothetical protein